jgi:hypothetical protein
MKTTSLFLSIVTLLIFSSGEVALGVEKITIPNDDVRVYSSPSVTSPVIAILKKGTIVKAGVNPGGGFKKVLIADVSKKKVIGYVTLMDLKAPIFAVAADPKDKKQKKIRIKSNGLGLRGHYSAGLEIGVNYQNQSVSQVSDSGGDSSTASGLSGVNFMLGLLFNFPVKPTISLETNLVYKPTTITGTGTATGTSNLSNIANRQNFVALSETVKLYSGPNSDWWYGPGLEMDYGMSGSLQLGQRAAYIYSSSDLKTLFMVYGATGYDFMSTKNFYITPSFRLGALINGSPLIIEADILISGSLRF